MKRPTRVVTGLAAMMFFTAAASAQATPTMQGNANSAPQPAHKPLPPVRKQAVHQPASLLPPQQARPSTAEAGPLRAGWKPLKEMPALKLTGADGKTTVLSPASKSRHWLLIYRAATCVPCDRLMLALSASTSPELKKGKPFVVLVDSPRPDALDTVRQGFTGLSDATWIADRNKQAFAALKPRGSPVLYAMEGSRVAWSIAGSLDSTATVTHIADSWIAANSQDAVATAQTAQASSTAAQIAAPAASAGTAATGKP